MKRSSKNEFIDMFLTHPDRSKYQKIFIIRTIGNILILSSMLFVFIQFYPVIAVEVNYRWTSNNKKDSAINQQTLDVLPTPDNQTKTLNTKRYPPLSEIPKDTEFGIVVEKIYANANVIASVDPFNADIYKKALNEGVAHSKGSSFPGEIGNIYLFAHNTLNVWDIPKYNAVFYLLHNLENGDRITTFYKQKRFDYIVFDKQIHDANDLSPLEAQYTESVLTLQTCWPPGTTWKRLIVKARLE